MSLLLILRTLVFPIGIFVALALRFDVSRGKQPQYFKSAFLGYTAGLALTIIVMNWFQAAQVTGSVASSFYWYVFWWQGIVTVLLNSLLNQTGRACGYFMNLGDQYSLLTFSFLFVLVFSPLFYILYLLLLDFWLLIAYGMVMSNRFVSLPNITFLIFLSMLYHFLICISLACTFFLKYKYNTSISCCYKLQSLNISYCLFEPSST